MRCVAAVKENGLMLCYRQRTKVLLKWWARDMAAILTTAIFFEKQYMRVSRSFINWRKQKPCKMLLLAGTWQYSRLSAWLCEAGSFYIASQNKTRTTWKNEVWIDQELLRLHRWSRTFIKKGKQSIFFLFLRKKREWTSMTKSQTVQPGSKDITLRASRKRQADSISALASHQFHGLWGVALLFSRVDTWRLLLFPLVLYLLLLSLFQICWSPRQRKKEEKK